MKKYILILLTTTFILVLSSCQYLKLSSKNTTTTTTTNDEIEVTNYPTVTNSDTFIVDYQSLKITKGNLYSLLKENFGAGALLEIIDRKILRDYEKSIDTTEKESLIESEKENLEDLVIKGVITSSDDENINEKIKEYIKVNLLRNAFIKANIKEENLSQDEVQLRFNELYKNTEVTVYDSAISSVYKSVFGENIKFDINLDNSNIIATYKDDDGIKNITTDEFYSVLSKRYGYYILENLINSEILKTVSKIQLTETEKAEYEQDVENSKANFNQSDLTWTQFLNRYYGVFNDEQLIDVITSVELIKRYIVGYNDFIGVDAIKEEEIQAIYEKWFSIEAYHILFTFDPSDEASKTLASTKANQVVEGCVEDSECYIKIEDDNFTGLSSIDSTNWEETFKILASEYSDDPSAIINYGHLGYFGPKMMIEKFELKTLEIAEDLEFPFGIAEETEIPSQTGMIYGYHVIFVKDVKEKPAIDELRDQFIKTLEQERLTSENIYKHLSKLRTSSEFIFNDEVLQNILENVNNLYIIVN